MDTTLYEVLERWATDEFRSMNAHIEYLLRESAKRAKRFPSHDHKPNNSDKDEQ